MYVRVGGSGNEEGERGMEKSGMKTETDWRGEKKGGKRKKERRRWMVSNIMMLGGKRGEKRSHTMLVEVSIMFYVTQIQTERAFIQTASANAHGSSCSAHSKCWTRSSLMHPTF